ncbi:MAG: hypothetical protein OHK0039_09850 [Bacteroidia bacterium]
MPHTVNKQAWYLAGALCWTLLLVSCTGADDTRRHPAQLRFDAQLAATCGSAVSYQRTARAAADTIWQATLLPFGPDNNTCRLLTGDLAYALAYIYDDPFIADQYAVQQRGDTLHADILPPYARRAALQEQTVVWLPDSSGYRYIASHVYKQSWLYRLDVHVAVHFDSTGRYLYHEQEIHTHIPLTNRTFHAFQRGSSAF